MRLRTDGALRRPPPQDVHLGAGALTLERAYYYCDACRAGICPRDRALGLHATSLSPGVLRMVGLAASDFSFAAASDLLWELAAVRVETKQVERAAEALGREVAADERDVAETVPSPAPTMYLGLDGTGVPVRPAEVEGRRGKQPDGSAKTREVKLATMWTAEGRDKAGRPVRDRGSVSYNAAVESAASRDTDPLPSAFAQRAYREAQRRGFDTAARRVVIGDGAPWICSWPPSSFPAPSKSSTSTTPSSICATWPRPSTAPERTWPTSGQGPACRVGRRPAPRRRRGATHPCRDHARGAKVHSLCVREPTPHTLSAVPRQGPVHLFGRRRGRMQADRRTAQARRHALDRRRRQRHHRPPLLPAQRPLRGLLGATSRKRRLRGVSQ